MKLTIHRTHDMKHDTFTFRCLLDMTPTETDMLNRHLPIWMDTYDGPFKDMSRLFVAREFTGTNVRAMLRIEAEIVEAYTDLQDYLKDVNEYDDEGSYMQEWA